MSGHNKWSKIKHKKEASDAKKSKEFGRLVRDIKVAVRESGGNAEASAVRLAVERAKGINMPKENIERAIASGQGGVSGTLEAVRYEAYGPGGAALLIEVATDNKNRTGAEIKKILSDHGTTLAAPGAAAWAFEHSGDSWTVRQPLNLPETDVQQLRALVTALESHEDVERVTTNASR